MFITQKNHNEFVNEERQKEIQKKRQRLGDNAPRTMTLFEDKAA